MPLLKHNEKDCFTQDPDVVRIAFDLPEALSYVVFMRKAARCLIESVGITSPDADEIELLIAELASNAARHANCPTYAVSLELSGKQVLITVTDTGTGFSIDSIPAPGTWRTSSETEYDERIGGFGLPLVLSLADQVDFEPNLPVGMTVRARKLLRDP